MDLTYGDCPCLTLESGNNVDVVILEASHTHSIMVMPKVRILFIALQI